MSAGYTSSMNDVEADEGSAVERDAELARLRRLAFGRTTTDAEVAAAAEARLRLGAIEAEAAARARKLEERARADRDAFQRARAEDEERQAHPLTPDDTEAPAAPRRAWLLPAAAGLLVGGVVAGGVAWALAPGPSEPSAVPATSAPSEGGLNYFLGDESADNTGEEQPVPPGDVEAAWRWFERAQTPDDLVGVPELRPEFDRTTVRLVHSSDNARVWVTMQTDGKLCLETTEITTQVTNGSCMGTDDFAVSALRVESNELTAVWTGTELSVVLSPR